MFHSDKELFQHILDEISFLKSESAVLTKEQFLAGDHPPVLKRRVAKHSGNA